MDLPLFIYGTGSDSDEQDHLIFKAIQQGYSAIDTGPTPAYREDLTARGIQQALSALPGPSTPDLFVQTKISPADRYQNEKSIPFELSDKPLQQVMKTFQQSKSRFSGAGCAIKALLLHAPFPTLDLTMQYWEAMESLVDIDADLQFLGICNATLATLQSLHRCARIKPVIVQNSFRPPSSYDMDVIDFCRAHGLIYQAYGILTSNLELLSSKLVGWFAETNKISEAEALFVLVASFGRGTIHILHASHNKGHMVADLQCVRLVGNVDETIVEAFAELLCRAIRGTHTLRRPGRDGASWQGSAAMARPIGDDFPAIQSGWPARRTDQRSNGTSRRNVILAVADSAMA